MEEIRILTTVDFYSLFISVIIILIGVKFIVSLFEWFVNKLGLETKWMRKRREEHDLLLQTSKNLSSLQEQHSKDVEQSIIHDNRIKNELSSFMNDVRNSIENTQNELTTAIKEITDGEKNRDKQIQALICGNKELLGAEIDKRYRQYIALDGIPESDVDEFDDIYFAYKNLGGNHSRDTKYSYVKDHLSVIPVETTLVMKQ